MAVYGIYSLPRDKNGSVIFSVTYKVCFSFRTLCWLSLYNCRKLVSSGETIESLKKLTQLQHLDLSTDDLDEPTRFGSFLAWSMPLVNEEVLEELLSCLPNLTSLDISG